MKYSKLKIIIIVFLTVIFLSACGFTPIKKEATRKKVHTKERPSLEEISDAKPSKERIVKKAKQAINESADISDSKLIFSSDRSGNLEIWISDLDGENEIQLTSDDQYESNWPRVSPDRSKVLFYRAPKGAKENAYDKFSL